MRVIAGKFRSRGLKALPSDETRPTSDRLKETLFNVMAAAGRVEGCRWADLFAGTGAIGIEALSRGAAEVCFVESAHAAACLLRQNLTALGLTAELVERDAVEALRQWEKQKRQFDVCFLDPPYRLHRAYAEVLRLLASGHLLAPGAVVVAEHDKRFDLGEAPAGLTCVRRLRQGDSALSFYRRETS